MGTTLQSRLLLTTMDESQLTSIDKCWAAITGGFVCFGALFFIGLSLMMRGDPVTGLVLALVSVVVFAILICAARVKYYKSKIASDRPPSYRSSWRRSFFRHLRFRQNETNTSVTSGSIFTITGRLEFADSLCTPSASTTIDSRPSTHPDHRAFQNSLFSHDGDDPPSYQTVLINMDEATKTKIRSQLQPPSPAL